MDATSNHLNRDKLDKRECESVIIFDDKNVQSNEKALNVFDLDENERWKKFHIASVATQHNRLHCKLSAWLICT